MSINRRSFLAVSSGLLYAISASSRLYSKDSLKRGLRVGFLPIADHLLIISKDFFENSEYEFVGIKFSDWPTLAESLRAKEIDVAFMLAPIGMKLRADGVNIRVLMNSHTNGSSLNVRIDSSIKALQDLHGKKIAIPSRFSSQYFLLDRILHKNNLTLKDIEVVDMGPPEMQSALSNKSIDAFIVAEPFGIIAKNKQVSRPLVYTKDIYPGHTCCHLVAHNWVVENKSVMKSLKDSISKARGVLLNDVDLATIMQKSSIGQNTHAIDEVLKNNITSYKNLAIDKQMLQEFKDFLIRERLSRRIKNLDIDSYVADI